eukprot:14614755-Ditylum_brightwellii.AAC.1
MALKLKGIKIPQKMLRRSDRIVVRRDPGSDVIRIDLTQWLMKREIFENCLQEQLKKYRKPFRELTMQERRKQIDEMDMEIMCYCLVRDESE